jgi:antitoxin component YwqK of YwqJK toxin-antitoxin module
MKYLSYFLIASFMVGCAGPASDLIEDIFMPNYRHIPDGNRTYYYRHPTKPNKFSDMKKWKVHWKDEKLISSTSWKPDGQKCPETNIINGNGLLVLYKEDGTELSRSHYKNGKQQKVKNH